MRHQFIQIRLDQLLRYQELLERVELNIKVPFWSSNYG